MSWRLVLAIVSTLMEEAALVALALWALPQIDIEIPLPGLILLMVVWGGFAVFTYRMGSRALRKEPLIGLPGMVGSRGKVVRQLAPDGIVLIKGELWEAKSAYGNIDTGEKVTVVGHDGLRVVVRETGVGGEKEPVVPS